MTLLVLLVEELDLVTLLQGDDRLLPVAEPRMAPAHPLLLAAHDHRVDVEHGDGKELLDRVLDLDLVRRGSDLEDHLVLTLAQTARLLRQDDGLLDDVLAGAKHGLLAAYLRQRSSSFLAASFVKTRWSWRRRSYTLTPSGGRKRCAATLRIDLTSFSFEPSSTTSAFLSALRVVSAPTRALVLISARSNLSTTMRRCSFAKKESALFSAAMRTLRGGRYDQSFGSSACAMP